LLAAIGAGTTKPGTLKTTIPVRGINVDSTFSYGGGAVDAEASRYFLADRTNKALDVFDTRTLTQVAQVKDGFAKPNEVIVADGNLYVTDTGKVHVITESTLKPAAPIRITATRFSDAGCFDPDDNLLMVANPDDMPAFVTWISTTTNAVFTRLVFNGTAKAPTAIGFGGCVYDPRTKNFFINNRGSTKNIRGELDVISAASVRTKGPRVSTAFGQGKCGPAGIVLGTDQKLFVACQSAAGVRAHVLFMSTSGTILKTVDTTGGGDKVAYDPKLDRYYCACFDWWSTGITGAGRPTPVLGIVDGKRMKLIVNTFTNRFDATSVSVDPKMKNVFVPVRPEMRYRGGINVYTP
jgi:hypothetical protein